LIADAHKAGDANHLARYEPMLQTDMHGRASHVTYVAADVDYVRPEPSALKQVGHDIYQISLASSSYIYDEWPTKM
jgi:hypothetical protein